MPTMREVIKHLEGYPQDKVVASVVWTEEDVLCREQATQAELGNEKLAPLSKLERASVLELVARTHDASLGITWDTIDAAIAEIQGGREAPSLLNFTCPQCGGINLNEISGQVLASVRVNAADPAYGVKYGSKVEMDAEDSCIIGYECNKCSYPLYIGDVKVTSVEHLLRWLEENKPPTSP